MIEKIERSILDRISQAAADRKLLCSPERVDTYKGELADAEVFIRSHRAAVLVSFADERLKSDDDNETLIEADFIVLCYARAESRRESDTRFGAAYQLIEDIKALLHKDDLGFLAEPLTYQGCEPVFNTRFSNYHTAMYELRFSCSYGMSNMDPEDRDDGSLNNFETLATTWELPEFTSKTTVELEQEEPKQPEE